MTFETPNTSERNEVKLAVVVTQMESIKSDVSDLKINTKADMMELKTAVKELTKTIDDSYVTKSEFAPVKAVVYGLVGLILTAVVIAVIYLVVQKP